jgi:SPP1 gp7 family putative phage head morphogenesis protein
MAEQLPISFNQELPKVDEKGQPIVYVNLTNTKANRASDIISYDIGLYRVKQDIIRWRNAIIYSENKTTPNRTEYYRLCKDVVLDPHLSSVMMQRKKAVLSRELVLVDKNGEVNEEKTKLFKKKWFRKFLDLALDKIFYGFTLIDLGPLVDDAFNQIKAVPRQYVRPELNIVVPATGSFSGTQIDDPRYKPWNIFIGERDDLGLLVKAAPWTIWKKGGMGYWSESNEKFGMPLRVGKTNTRDEEQKYNMETALKSMGSAFYAMIDKDDELDLISSKVTRAWENFSKMAETCDDQNSKLVLGQTGTTDEKAFAGSSKVHQSVMADVTEGDIADLEADLNEIVKGVLNYHGFGLEDLQFEFRFKEAISVEEKSKIDASFMPHLKDSGLKFSKEYLEKTYDVELEEIEVKDESEPDDNDKPEVDVKKKPITNYEDITKVYETKCGICGGYENKEKDEFRGDFFDEEDEKRIIEGVQQGRISTRNLPLFMFQKTVDYFEKALLEGFEVSAFGDADTLLQELRMNIYHFSAAKTYQQVRDINALLVKYKVRKDLFLKNASTVFKDYNKVWMATEYDTAISSALMSRNWQRIEKSKQSLPYLEYHTVGDSLVRPTHAALDGITRKVGDAFWDTYYPPNGWRCRCSTLQHDDVEQITSLKDFKAPDDVPDLFKFNPGKDGMIFSEKHPYFKVAKGDKEWAIKNFGLPMPEL